MPSASLTAKFSEKNGDGSPSASRFAENGRELRNWDWSDEHFQKFYSAIELYKDH